MTALRRYEILLPSRFNDGRPVPENRFEHLDVWMTTYPIETI
jgi:hypothetical protein